MVQPLSALAASRTAPRETPCHTGGGINNTSLWAESGVRCILEKEMVDRDGSEPESARARLRGWRGPAGRVTAGSGHGD